MYYIPKNPYEKYIAHMKEMLKFYQRTQEKTEKHTYFLVERFNNAQLTFPIKYFIFNEYPS